MNDTNAHIALFLPSLRGGGAERVMVTLANGIAACGYRVDLVLTKAEGPYLKDVASTVRVVDLGASRVLFSLPPLVRYLRKERPDALLSALNHANVIALLALKIACIETCIIVSEHSTLSRAQGRVVFGCGKCIPWFMRWLYPAANGVIAVSSGVADDLARAISFPRDRIKVIYNPIVVNASSPTHTLRPGEHPWLFDDTTLVILAAGRLTVAKDYPTLIRAFKKILNKQKVRLVILGEGELRSEIEKLILQLNLKEHTFLPGFVENPYDWMRASSLFVLSSAWEGLPSVLIEAMACGIPVVSTNCPSGPSEILENGKWGRLVPVGDVDALAGAMLAALAERARPDVVIRAQDFGLEQAVQGYLAVLLKKASSRAGYTKHD